MRSISFSLGLLFLALGMLAVGCAGSPGVAGPAGGTTGTGGTRVTGGTTGGGGSAGIGGSTGSGGKTGLAGNVGTGGTRTACAAPSQYRNLFVEVLGKTQTDVDNKLKKIVDQLFHGTGEQPIYYEMGTDQAYVLDVANGDIRSEGMSYGMFIAVAMDMKTEFDKLWKFASTRMRQSTGLFAWQMNTSGGVISPYAAPDGEEYFAMALLLASRRWGDGGTNYGSEAKKVMNAIISAGEWNKSYNLINFGPGNNYTDASYVLPLFYSEWACFDTANASTWKSGVAAARSFFAKATDKSTGLAPDKSNFDGSAYNGSTFAADAWRVPMNIMADYYLNNADPWQVTYAKTHAAFWTKEGLNSYGDQYTLSGTKQNSGHGAGQVGVNAMLAFALPAADGKPFLQAAWDVAVPTGTYRYYNGCLFMLSWLYLSGKLDLYY